MRLELGRWMSKAIIVVQNSVRCHLLCETCGCAQSFHPWSVVRILLCPVLRMLKHRLSCRLIRLHNEKHSARTPRRSSRRHRALVFRRCQTGLRTKQSSIRVQKYAEAKQVSNYQKLIPADCARGINESQSLNTWHDMSTVLQNFKTGCGAGSLGSQVRGSEPVRNPMIQVEARVTKEQVGARYPASRFMNISIYKMT